MFHPGFSVEEFKRQLRNLFRDEALDCRAIKVARHANVYNCGDHDEKIHFIESGQIKLLMLSPEGKECLLAVQGAGEIFGEVCLSGIVARRETATAMEESILKQMPHSQFLARLSRDSLLEDFVCYLTVRIAEQQRVIANMVTADSEQRLGTALLQLGRTLGKKDARGHRIETKISHEELSEMVGTTRPRISVFMERFRKNGLIERNIERSLVIKEKQLTDYLALRASGHA
jgi:CRP/FNR family transcriptional regulator, cyclic AMP receptor protein